tara:strand:+ start:9018 stop:11522 length:2505 start_codon:yes stop_codon:yes gene_type:complete
MYTPEQLRETYSWQPAGFSASSVWAPAASDPNDPGQIILNPNDSVVLLVDPNDPGEFPPDPNELPEIPPDPVQYSSNLINLERVWQHSVWGSNLGESGIAAADLDGDGSTELVLGATLSRNFGANKNWHIVKRDPRMGTYEIVYTSDDNPDWSSDRVEINAISVFENSFVRRILVGYDNGMLSVYDGETRNLVRSIAVSSSEILSVVQGDGDNDGFDEIIVSTENNTYFFNPSNLSKKSELPIGGRELSIGNVDSDPMLELVYVEGPVVEFDGSTAIQQWDFSGFSPGRWLELGDLDGDGVEELIVARSWYYIDILDAENRTPLRQISTSTNISQLKVVDVTGDTVPEVLYGDQQHGAIHAVDGVSLNELWQLSNPSSGAPGIEVADVDDDGELEVIWGSGSNSTAPDFLSIHDIATLEREFINFDEGGPFRGLALGDTDGDGVDEIVVLGSEGNRFLETRDTDSLPLRVVRSLDLSPEWSTSDYPIDKNQFTYMDVAIGNIDGEGADDIIVAHGYLYDLNIDVIDGVSKSLVSSNRLDMDTANSISLADFDGDERMEIVAASGNQLHIIDSATMSPIWSSIVLNGVSTANNIEAVDVYGDGLPDLVASIGRILIVDGVSKIYRQSSEANYGGFAVVGNAGSKQIIAGTDDGLLVSLEPDTFDRTVLGSVCDGAVNSVRADTSPAFLGSIQFACQDTIGIWSMYEQQLLWRSPLLGTQVGLNNNLIAMEQNGEALLVVGTGHGVQAFRGDQVSNRDADSDGMFNHLDNCPQEANPNQEDRDGDGVGDACNNLIDSDGDDWSDSLDNCPFVANPGQEDLNSNGRGDACDALPPGC